MKVIYFLVALWMLIWQVEFSDAVREGTANAKVMIQRYERDGNFAKVALWHEAAADCLQIISVPMTEIQIRYYLRHGNNAQAEWSRGKLAAIKKRREHHRQAAQTHWERSETERTSAELKAEREKITQFISTWVQTYPNRFYHYGIYPSFFKVEQEIFKKKGDYAAVLNLEADAAEICADQYNEITVAYFREIVLGSDQPPCEGGKDNPDSSGLVRGVGVALNQNAKETVAALGGEAISRRGENHLSKVNENRVTQYEKVRDAHRQRATLLRGLAEGKPETPPIEAESVLKGFSHQSISPAPKLTSTQALRIASGDARLQEYLKAHTGVHEYASYQGFAWFVSYSNHGWGNLAIALVDDKTGTVLDILIANPKNR